MLEILSKKEAISRYMEGAEVYTTTNFVGFKKIERRSLEDIREEKDWDGDHIFFVQQTEAKYFKTRNDSFLNMERITWEKFRDICLNYCYSLKIPECYFLIEDNRKDISQIAGISRVMNTQIKGMTFERLEQIGNNCNIYKFKIKEAK